LGCPERVSACDSVPLERISKPFKRQAALSQPARAKGKHRD
jgi:hypothetical protein